jgi:HEAT repeat protein
VLPRLENRPWFVQRNMLYILSQLDEIPEDFQPQRWLDDDDDRIRREAIRLALRMPAWRLQAIKVGLEDDDERIQRLVLGAALETNSPSLVCTLIELLEDEGIESSIRALAISVLGRTGSTQARDWIVRCAAAGGRWWQPWQIASKSDETLAAIAVLRERWPGHSRVDQILSRACRSPDPDIRAAAEGIAA